MAFRRQEQARQRRTWRNVVGLLASNCILGVVAPFAFGFISENFVIPSSSMASTLMVGNHVLVDRSMLAPPASWAKFLPYRDVRRGDIVVFYKPTEEA